MDPSSTKQDWDSFAQAFLFLIRMHVALLGLALCTLPIR